MIELSEHLKSNVERVMQGNILDMPLLHKQDVEKICYYCIGMLNDRLKKSDTLNKEFSVKVDLLTEQLTVLVDKVDALEKKKKRF